jgi:hypothetical protein
MIIRPCRSLAIMVIVAARCAFRSDAAYPEVRFFYFSMRWAGRDRRTPTLELWSTNRRPDELPVVCNEELITVLSISQR